MAFKGKVALITGGASGMGRVAALKLANQGAKVAIVDVNDDALASVAAEHENLTPFNCDTSDLDQVRKLVTDVEAALGPIDRLTQCAAIMPGQSIKEMTPELTNKMMAINYGGTVNMVSTVWPLMDARGSGDIIIFGSMAGDVLTHNLGGYSATKSATNTWAEVLHHENKDTPLRFLLVCPPMVNTPLVQQAIENGPESIKTAGEDRMVTPEFIIDAAEEALEKGDWVVRPGSAKWMVRLRRYFPRTLWRIMEKANNAG